MSELSENSNLSPRPDSRPDSRVHPTSRTTASGHTDTGAEVGDCDQRQSSNAGVARKNPVLDTLEFSDLKLHNMYAARLLAFARQRIPARLRSVLDAEEVVQETFLTYFRGIQSAQLTANDSGDEWPLLAVICRRKLLEHLQWYGRSKRNTQGQINLSSLESHDSDTFQFAHRDHTASCQFRIAEIHNRTRKLLNQQEIEINDARLEGLSDEQLQERFGCGERTIRRAIAHYRELLEQQLRIWSPAFLREAD